MRVIKLNLKPNEIIGFISDLHLDCQQANSRTDDILTTLMNKMEDVLNSCKSRNVKALFFAGDVVNRTGMPFSPINAFIELLIKYREAGIGMYSICGNHDVMRNSLDYIGRSPIQTLFSSGLMTHINLESKVLINDSILITPVDYMEYPVSADKNVKTNILLCHMFIEANEFLSDDKHNLRVEDIVQLDYDYIFAGHDHKEYPIREVGKTKVYRIGSVLRGTSHDYNFQRKPNFIVFTDLNNICQETIETVEIAHKPYKDVVSNYVLNRKHEGSLSGLKDVLSNLAERLAMSSDKDDDRILEIIKTDPNLPNDSRLQLLHYISEVAG